ncbi:MAG: hypothetical protein AAGA18_12165 [Verrucomicrobiota bacterium]
MYPFELSHLCIVLGLLYLAVHGYALYQSDQVKQWLAAFPRNEVAGTVLTVVAGLWFGWILATQDLMDYSQYRKIFLIALCVSVGLLIIYLKEFLAVRALGCVGLLCGGMMLDVGFMRPELPRLLISFAAYVYIFLSMFWIGAPYLMRDQISWVCARDERFKCLAGAGVGFGVIILGLGIFVF